MTKEHPITPPPELIAKWAASMCGYYEAARWGADQELEACVEWASCFNYDDYHYDEVLRSIRRPEPPSLKEQALDSWDRLRNEAWCEEIDFDLDFIRRALESLPD
jgi:hypothetical protein